MSADTESFDGVKCIRETAMAILVRFDDDTGSGPSETWIPKSVVDEDSEVYGDGHEGELVVKRWWAEKEGLS